MHDVVDDLATLVGFPTVSDRPVTALAAHLAQRFEDLGFDITRFDDPTQSGKTNIVARIGPRGTDGLILSGHMDVVPTEGQPWTSDPFVLTEREGKLLGRGTADMKGFFAATLQALARIRPEAYTRELVLIWTHDEEVGCLGSAHLCHSLDGEPLPTACLIGEPTDFRILRMHAGHAVAHVDIRGQAAHSSLPHLGANAIVAAGEVLRALSRLEADLQLEEPDDPMIQPRVVPMNVAQVSGGTAINVVPDHCRLDIGFRPTPGMDSHAVFRRIAAAVAALDLSPCTATTTPGRITPSMLTQAGTDLERLLSPHARPGAYAAPFATDGGNLSKLGTQPLVFGPGSIDVAHKADEYVDATELIRAVDVVEAVVRSRCA